MAHGMKARIAATLIVCDVFMVCVGQVRAQAISETKDEIAYRVKAGDTLIGLSQRFMVRPDSYVEVQRINRLANPDSLAVGKLITIPTRLLRSTPISGEIVAFRGTVTLASGTQSKQVAVGMAVVEGAQVETGDDGYVTLGLANGSRMSLPSKSRVRITRMRKYNLTSGTDFDFEIDRGRSEISVTPQPDPRNRFRMRTPIAVSAVRGTVFRIGYSGINAPSLTEVIEGKVGVTVGTTRAAIPKGFGAAAAESGEVLEEQLLPPPTIVEPTRLQRNQDVAFTLSPNAKAVGYHVQVATDAKFVDIVAGARSSTNSVSLGALSDGAYFVRAMAVAPSGLEGLFETFEFQRELKTLVSQPTAGKGRAQAFSWGAKKATGEYFRLQIFDAQRPSLPLIDETGLEVSGIDVVGLRPGEYRWRVGTAQLSGQSVKHIWTPFEALRIPE